MGEVEKHIEAEKLLKRNVEQVNAWDGIIVLSWKGAKPGGLDRYISYLGKAETEQQMQANPPECPDGVFEIMFPKRK